MRKLLFLLSVSLLLVGCNDVDEFGQMLPDSVTLDEVRSVSDLTYEELETLVPDESQREEMRRNGGLLVQPDVVTSLSQQRYDDMYVYYSSSESGLPPYEDGYDYMDILSGSEYSYAGIAYISWYNDEQRQMLPGRTIYCKASVELWGGEQKPGFVDEIRDDDYYGGDRIYSGVRSYAYPDAPLISDFDIYEGDFIQASFRIVMPSASDEMPECGLCYSATNQLPTVDTDAVVNADENYSSDGGMSYYPYATIQTVVGTYYVRAFVRGANGEVSYSPVRRASCQGGIASTEILPIINVSEIGYGELLQILSVIGVGEDVQSRIRQRGGTLIVANYVTENGTISKGLSTVTSMVDLPQGSGFTDGGAEPIHEETSSDGSLVVYWHPAEYYSIGDTATTYFYQSALEVTGTINSLWTYSDVQSYTMYKPIVTNFSIDSYDASVMNLSWYIYWGDENEDWTAGVCYSTATDLPTVDDNIVNLEDQEFTINWDTPLAPGTYYFRFFVRTARGIGYSPVQQVTITEDMTR